MFSLENKTYFFTFKGMITIDNTIEFISTLLESLIEMITTSHPVMFRFKNDDKILMFVIGYNNIFIVKQTPKNIEIEPLSKEFTEFMEEVICEIGRIIKKHEKEKEYKEIISLYEELIICSKSIVELNCCYDIRKKSIDDLLYAYENKKYYAIIYDKLDEITETYRIILDSEMYIITDDPIATNIELHKIGIDDFSRLLIKELKKSKNKIIRKSLKRLQKYIEKEK